MVGIGFVAIAFFSQGGRMSYASETLDDAMTRAKFWHGLFVEEYGGRSVEGEEVTSICVRQPCGNEIELLRKKK
jgi:hypothetical protein